MGNVGDGFIEWLKETFVEQDVAQQQDDDLLINDQRSLLLPTWQGQQVPDTQVLVQQMQAPLDFGGGLFVHAAACTDSVSNQCSIDATHDIEQLDNKARAAKKPRPKNTKRYKSVAQKEAHKRYRERKKQNINAMEQTVAAKLQLLQQLEAENAALKSKMRVLETSVNCSTQIHGLMQLINGVSSLSVADNSSSGAFADSSATSGQSGAAMSSSPVAAGAAADVNAFEHSTGSVHMDAAGGLETGYSADSSAKQEQRQVTWLKDEDQHQLPLDAWANTCMQMQQQHQQQWQKTTDASLRHASSAPAIVAESRRSPQADPIAHSVNCPGITAPAHTPTGNTAPATTDSSTPPGQPGIGPGLRSISGSTEISTGSGSSLQEIFAEVQQQSHLQRLQASGGLTAGTYTGAPDPLATAVSSVEQGVMAYKAFLQRASALIMERETSGPGPAAAAADEQLDNLTRSTISQLFQPFLIAKGHSIVYDWIYRNLETQQRQEPPADLWPHVLQQMKLTPQQQQDALACYRMFGVCLSKLVDQRMALTAQYKAQQKAELDARQECNHQGKLLYKIESMETLQAISKSLSAYQSLDGVFSHSVTSIITGSQLAEACVHSYPFVPNWHSIMHTLQLQHEQNTAEDPVEVAMQQAQQPKTAARRKLGRSVQPLGVQHAVRA